MWSFSLNEGNAMSTRFSQYAKAQVTPDSYQVHLEHAETFPRSPECLNTPIASLVLTERPNRLPCNLVELPSGLVCASSSFWVTDRGTPFLIHSSFLNRPSMHFPSRTLSDMTPQKVILSGSNQYQHSSDSFLSLHILWLLKISLQLGHKLEYGQYNMCYIEDMPLFAFKSITRRVCCSCRPNKSRS